MPITKAVITAAGLGTRLMPFAKILPKEMVPLFVRDENGLHVKPIIQIIFENLYHAGIRDFCIVTGRGKRTIEDHFTIDRQFVKFLRDKNKMEVAQDIENFYDMIDDSSIFWVNQSEPLGFGHAVLQAKPYVNNDDFLVHAGDTWIYPKNDYIQHLMNEFERKDDTTCMLILKTVRDPRAYGVAEIMMNKKLIYVTKVIEKPKKPKTNLAIMPVYCFSHKIFPSLEKVSSDKMGEIQLTDAIQTLVNLGKGVRAVKMKKGENLDVGSPTMYMETLKNLFYFLEQH